MPESVNDSDGRAVALATVAFVRAVMESRGPVGGAAWNEYRGMIAGPAGPPERAVLEFERAAWLAECDDPAALRGLAALGLEAAADVVRTLIPPPANPQAVQRV